MGFLIQFLVVIREVYQTKRITSIWCEQHWSGVNNPAITPFLPIGPPPCPPYPATSYPGWCIPPVARLDAPHPNHGTGAGSQHDRVRYLSHFPILTSDGDQH